MEKFNFDQNPSLREGTQSAEEIDAEDERVSIFEDFYSICTDISSF